MSDKKLGLSRRRVLGGLGAIGVASAGAGLGTSAYFNDVETFEENSFQAGTFSMEVELLDLENAVDQDGIGPDEDDWYSESGDGEGMVGASIDISDLKPGDTYNFCWCIDVDGNPGVVRAYIPWDSVEHATGIENGTLDDGASDDLPGVETDDDFETLLGSEDITVSKNLYVCEENEDGDHVKGEQILENDITYDPDDSDTYAHDGGLGNWVTSLSDNDFTSQDGVPIGSHNGVGTKNPEDDEDPLSEGESDYILIGSDEGSHWGAVAYCMTIEVSEDAGNELQGASASFDLQFRGEQARHNDHPFSDLATRPRTDDPTDWTDIPV
ncbi:SipW-dependent-type signal peptide-containing protein [Haloarchaeobius litoreus]|uniref:SipW-dependent-type signal peptide-containing protein n=1 Tax=Haloarchaeobius litoreus TaxID=755306 RepID=A0ABD6DDM1_9EURY|nr:SipW-dependent-type signal peptide-containing protein [Haloarchaeobius litoreus]